MKSKGRYGSTNKDEDDESKDERKDESKDENEDESKVEVKYVGRTKAGKTELFGTFLFLVLNDFAKP